VTRISSNMWKTLPSEAVTASIAFIGLVHRSNHRWGKPYGLRRCFPKHLAI
jgi:hypothetical protein